MCDLHETGMTATTATQTVLDQICSGQCHVSTLKLAIKNLEALKAACQRLGLEFREGQQTYAWFGRFMGDSPLPEGFTVEELGKCSHAIRAPGASYEVGVHQLADGTFRLLYDSWSAGGLTEVLGDDLNKLRQAYGISAAVLEAQRQGYSVWEQPTEDGAVRLHVMLPA